MAQVSMGSAITIGAILFALLMTVGIHFLVFRSFKNGNRGMGAFAPQMMVAQVQAVPFPAPIAQGPKQVKKSVCQECGASKVQPPRTAYLYCDYCGALVDWDVQNAISTAGSAKPDTAYQQLEAQVAPTLSQALAIGDKPVYRTTLNWLLDQHMRYCPAAYSPRLGDPSYRAAMLEFQVSSILETDFDPETQRRKAAMKQSAMALQAHARMTRRLEVANLAQLLTCFQAYQQRFMQVVDPFVPRHPDRPSAELISAIMASMFAQTWLPLLDQAGQNWLIGELGLQAEYMPVPPMSTTERHCGHCGASLFVVPGAHRVVCEHCGYVNNVQLPELPCTGCGAPLSIPAGVAFFSCPYCQVDVRVAGHS